MTPIVNQPTFVIAKHLRKGDECPAAGGIVRLRLAHGLAVTRTMLYGVLGVGGVLNRALTA